MISSNLSISFTQTSNEPYLRHHYKLVYANGDFTIFDNYEDVQVTWWNTSADFLSHVEVLDIEQKKNKKGGFKK